MDTKIIKSFLNERLSTREATEEAAAVAGVSVATMYRYKSNPEGMGVGTLAKLSEHIGLPLSNGVSWNRMNILGSERRRLTLERVAATAGGARFTTVAPYTVNSELPEITKILLEFDYGTRATAFEAEVLAIRLERAQLYDSDLYDSWEIWSGAGYADFFAGRGRFAAISEQLRQKQITAFVESSMNQKRHRYFYTLPDLPAFGCYSSSGVALVRVDDIHLEFQEPALVLNFEETFNELLDKCHTKTRDEFVTFLSDPSF